MASRLNRPARLGFCFALLLSAVIALAQDSQSVNFLGLWASTANPAPPRPFQNAQTGRRPRYARPPLPKGKRFPCREPGLRLVLMNHRRAHNRAMTGFYPVNAAPF